jgi:uncharacterized protein
MFQRGLETVVRQAVRERPVVLLQGARQVGKSTLATSALPDARYLTLDDAPAIAFALSDPQSFVQQPGDTLIIDEVQRAPDLLRAVKLAVDRDRRAGRFLLTGSANVMLLPKASESLAGRMEIITLHGLSQGEIEGRLETFIDWCFGPSDSMPVRVSMGTPLATRISRGGFPEVVTGMSGAARARWFDSYLTAILQRDIRDLANIDDSSAMPRLLSALAGRSANLLNTADLSRTLGLPTTTLRRYLTLLQASYMVSLMPAWSANTTQRLVKAPKVHLYDTGLLSHLLKLGPENYETHASKGAALETFVASELTKQAGWSAARPQLFHFRSHTGQEVDMVLEDTTGAVVGVEVKASQSVDSSDFGGLRVLAGVAGKKFVRGVVIYAGDTALKVGEGLWALPVAALWSR